MTSAQQTAPEAVKPSYRFTFEPAPQARIRLVLNDTIIADTSRAMVMRETRLPPVLYFPLSDIRMDFARRTDQRTYCPFKGNACYWSFEVGGNSHEDLMWSYEDPFSEAREIKGYAAFYPDQVEVIESGKAMPVEDRTVEDAPANPLVDWLLRDAPLARSGRELTAELATQLLKHGMPLWRMALIIRTLHPQVVSYIYLWRLDNPDIEEAQTSRRTLDSPEFLNSPLLPIFDGAGGIRRRLEGPNPILDFGILEELRQQGATDYVAMPMVFSDDKINALTIATDRPGGFKTAELGRLYEVLGNLGRLYEVHAARRKATALLETYLGPHAGARVLSGQIHRGDGDNIKAVIWFCDLRESTPLAESMSREDFLGVLNEFFDCMAGAVMQHGGEVLRFIGDAALAIFPIDDAADDAQTRTMSADTARHNALQAVLEATARIDCLNVKREAKRRAPLRYGIALHIGDVTYGNIGTQDRLEFTVIGDAANRAARIESMCKLLDRPVLLSAEFACHFPDQTESLGTHELRGVSEPVELFGLAPGASTQA